MNSSHKSRSHQLVLALGLAAFVLSWPMSSSGLSIKAPAWKQLVKQADWVVRVTVLKNQQTQLSNGLPVIQTHFQVLSTYKGTKTSQLVIQLLGGTSKKYHIKLASLPRFTVNSQVILFLRKSKHTRFPILVGLYHGVFDLRVKKGTIHVTHRGQKHDKQDLPTFKKRLQLELKKQSPTLVNRPTNNTAKSK